MLIKQSDSKFKITMSFQEWVEIGKQAAFTHVLEQDPEQQDRREQKSKQRALRGRMRKQKQNKGLIGDLMEMKKDVKSVDEYQEDNPYTQSEDSEEFAMEEMEDQLQDANPLNDIDPNALQELYDLVEQLMNNQ